MKRIVDRSQQWVVNHKIKVAVLLGFAVDSAVAGGRPVAKPLLRHIGGRVVHDQQRPLQRYRRRAEHHSGN